MRFSEVVGKGFYNIKVAAKDAELLDVHFSGACHHRGRWLQAEGVGVADFHFSRYQAHLCHLMEIIYQRGDFSCATDESNNNRDEREAWNPDRVPIPDPEMFDDLLPDARYPLGIPHDLDSYLTHMRGPVEILKRPDLKQAFLVRKRAMDC